MKKNLFLPFGMVIFVALLLTGCPDPKPEPIPELSGTLTVNPSGTAAVNTELTATYSGNEAVSFQWKKDGSNIGTASTTNPNKYTPTTEGSYTVAISATGYNAKTSGAITVTAGSVSDTPITSVSITIIAPVKDEVPATTATASGAVNFTIGTITWSPADNPYQGGKVYTASVTLTAASGYTFTDLTTATANGQTATVSNNTGGNVTLSYAFPATDIRTFKSMSIKTQPSKLTYSHNDTLELAGITVTLNYNDNSSDDIAATEFAAKNITASPADGDTLIVTANNGKPVTIRYGSHTVDTNSLTVNPITPVLADFTITGLSQEYDGNPKSVTVTANDGKTTGTVTVKYDGSETAPSNAGTYPITIDVIADTNYTLANGLSVGTLTINKATPTIDDFIVNGLTQTYDGSAKAVTVTAKTGITGMGTATTKYDGNDAAPSMDGTYAVTFNVAEGTNYTAVNGLSTGTLTVTLPPFTTIDGLGTWLSNKPANTAATAYNVVLNVNNLDNYNNSGSLGYTLNNNKTKYVNLDLSGSTFNRIQQQPFYGCTSLIRVTIGSSVTSIGSDVFDNCTGLTAINIDSANNAYSSVDGVLYNNNKTTLIQYPLGKTESFAIPNSVTSIGNGAFSNCTGLTSVTIPDSVTSIGLIAFSNCTNLISVTIPNSVTNIGDRVFYGCKSLTAIDVDSTNNVYSSADGVLYNNNKTTLIQYPVGRTGSFAIPNSVTSIVDYAFNGCTNLTSVNIPDSVTSIADYAFYGCYNLTSVNIPNSITSIGEGVFYNCAFTSVIIPNSVTSIRDYAFYGCNSLISIIFEKADTSIDANAFINSNNTTSLQTAYTSGGIGTYTRPNTSSTTWTKSTP